MRKPWIILSIAGVLGLGAAGMLLAGSALASDVKGTADNITNGQLSVGGKLIRIDDNTKIQGQLVAGSRVEIKTRQSDGALVAVRIHVKADGSKAGENEDEASDNEQEGHGATSANYTDIEGQVTTLSANSFVVDGKTITTNNATRTDGQVAVGSEVEVKASVQPDGTLVAVKIEAEGGAGETEGQRHENRESEQGEDGDDGENGQRTTSSTVTQPTPPAPNAAPVSYAATIQPLLAANCLGCHSGQGVSVSSYAAVRNLVAPGNPAASTLYKVTSSGKMPPGGSLTASQMQNIANWIYQGAQNN